jgi:DNA-binding PadR family transcriptional regulator
MERELLLLGLLRREHMHGYRLNEFIGRDMDGFIDLKKPTAYALLDKMEQQGWITTQQEQQGNRPPRRIYQITEEGEHQFKRLLRENLGQFRIAHFSGDVGLAFISELQPEEAIELLMQRRAELNHEIESGRNIPRHEGSLQWIIEHRMFHLESELHWLDEVINRLAQNKEE